jgi:large subunit ribosomal protein L29
MPAGLQPGELRQLEADELLTRLREAKEELFNLRFQVATGQLDNNRRLHTVRRDIARIYTIMRERELGLSGLPGGPAPATPTPDETDSEGAA